MKRFCLILSIIGLVMLVASCTYLQTTTIPTSIPVDNITSDIELTAQAGQVESPTATLVSFPSDFPPRPATQTPQENPSAIQSSSTSLAYNPTTTSSPSPNPTSTTDLSATPSRRATRTPTITPTPPIPNAGAQIDEPGPMSKVVSPIHLTGNIRSIASGTYHIEIWLEPLQPDGEPRLLYREVQRIISNPVDWVYLDQQIPFELSRVSELGQLRVSIYDSYGRPFSVNSVDLVLLSMGVNTITPDSGKSEPIVIRQPTPNQLIQGGKVIVSGLAKPSEDFMLVELVAADGSIPGYSQVFVTPAPDGSYVPYSIEVPYKVDAPVWVRLRISESSVRIPGIEHLSSVEVYLTP